MQVHPQTDAQTDAKTSDPSALQSSPMPPRASPAPRLPTHTSPFPSFLSHLAVDLGFLPIHFKHGNIVVAVHLHAQCASTHQSYALACSTPHRPAPTSHHFHSEPAHLIPRWVPPVALAFVSFQRLGFPKILEAKFAPAKIMSRHRVTHDFARSRP